MAVFVLFALLISLLARSDATKCFECQSIPFPRDCLNVRVCNSDEICFTEQVVTTSGNIIYNSGCLSKTRCSAASGRILGKRTANITQRSSTDILTCIECCDGDYCNNQGCGAQIAPIGLRGPYCFNCDTLLDPKACSDVAVCDITEQCLLYSPGEFGGLPETVYRSQCENKAACSVLSQTFKNHRCPPSCCATDFCNNECGVASNQSMTTPRPYTTPTYIQTQPAVVSPSQETGSCNQDHFYDDITGMCIKIDESSQMNYADAKRACEAIGDQLVTVDSHEKTVFIENMILHHTSLTDVSDRKYFIGALDTHHNGEFFWPNGHKIFYTNWGGGDEVASNQQPDGLHAKYAQDCVILYGPDHYQWHDDRCSHTAYYICEDRSTLKGSTAYQTDPPVTLPPPTHHSSTFHCDAHGGYMLLKSAHEQLCVHIVTHHANWDSARASCKAEGGDLVILDNSEKASLMRSKVNQHAYSTQTGYWIGAKDFSYNNHFSWVNQKQVTYGDWYPGQPNHNDGGHDQDCACMWSSGEHYQWHDDYCAKFLGYICEKR